MSERNRVLRHLVQDYSEPVRDPIWKNISLSPFLLRLVGKACFQKLHGIKQLGPTYLVYPGATHSRLNHSLGVFHIAWRMILHLLKKYDPPSCTLPGVKAFLCASLLHDLGHYPYAHSLKELDLESHESLTARRILEEDFARVIAEQTDPHLVAAIIDPGIDYRGSEDIRFFRNLLSGVLDPDKLDYLNRDAYFCGVPYGTQDVDFILDEIMPHAHGIAITSKGLIALESILFSKYLMYRSVYWHKTVRIATAMIKKALLMGLMNDVIRAQDLYWLDDQAFYAMANRYDYPPFQLIFHVAQRNFYKVLFSIPFSRDNPLHLRLEDLSERMAFESEVARALEECSGRRIKPEDLIVDIPEPISFEIKLPVLDPTGRELVSFLDSGSAFDVKVVEGFTKVLRTVSLITIRDNEIFSALEDLGGDRILEKGI